MFEPEKPEGLVVREGFDKQAPDVQPYGYMDLFRAAGDAASRYIDPAEQYQKKLPLYGDNIRAYEKATGRDFSKDVLEFAESSTDRFLLGDDPMGIFRKAEGEDSADFLTGTFGFSADLKRRAELIESFFESKMSDPQFSGLFKTKEDVENLIREQEEAAASKLDEVRSSFGDDWLATGVEIGGTMFESAKDAENIATMLIPGGAAKTVLRKAIVAAAENMAVELIQYSRVREYNEDVLGGEYGLDELGKSMLFSGATGGVMGAAGGVISKRYAARQAKSAAQVLDDVADIARKNGDSVTSTVASLEAERLRSRDFNLSDKIEVEGAAAEPFKTISKGKADIREVTRAKFDLTPSKVMDIDPATVKDIGKRAEIEEIQDLIRNKGFEGDDIPPKAEGSPINEFESAEAEGFAPGKSREQVIEDMTNRLVDESKGLANKRLVAELDSIAGDTDARINAISKDQGLDPVKLREELDAVTRLEAAIATCRTAR